MIIQTHLLIAERVNNSIKNFLNLEISSKNFMYGNIKPDIVYRLSKKSHRIKHSFNFVLEEMEHLMTSTNISLEQYSINLGVISHFVSDFFCTPHYYELDEYKSIINHVNYEIKLHAKFKKMMKNSLLDISNNDVYKFKKNNILDCIKAIEEIYSKIDINMGNDIIYGLLASTVICIGIIENSLIFSTQKVAA